MGRCDNCKHAIFLTTKIYCSKLKQPAAKVKVCPFFEEEPKIYKLYIRA